MEIRRNLSSSKVEAQQPVGNNPKKKLDFSLARRQKPLMLLVSTCIITCNICVMHLFKAHRIAYDWKL